jgi:hypothetical protein
MLLDHDERTLRAELPGSDEYAARVRYRLIPYVWSFDRRGISPGRPSREMNGTPGEA